MRGDELDVGASRHGVGIDEADHHAGGLGRILEGWCRVALHHDVVARPFRWMDEHDRLAAVQLVHHRGEAWVAKVDALVVRHHDDAVQLEFVVNVRDLRQRCVHVRQWEDSEATKARRTVTDDAGEFGVQRTSQTCGCRSGPIAQPRRGQRQHLGLDVVLVHEVDPLLHVPAGHRETDLLRRDPDVGERS